MSPSANQPSLMRDGLFIFLSVFVAGIVSFECARGLSGLYPVWWPNGVLLGALLVSNRRRWPMLLAVGAAAILLAHAPLPAWEPQILWLTGGSLVEVWLAAILIRWWADGTFTLTTIDESVRFVLIAVLLAPLLSGLFAIGLGRAAGGLAFGGALMHWYFANALGIATATPVMLAAYRGSVESLGRQIRNRRSARLLILLTIGGFFSLFQPDLAVLGLLFPVLIVLVFRLGWTAGGLGVLLLSVIASGLTAVGHGAFAAMPNASVGAKTLALQLFLASLAVSAAIVATVYEERHRVLRQASQKEQSARLLAEYSPDLLLLTDLSGRALYANRAVTSMLGYMPAELYRKSFQTELLHPDHAAEYTEALDAIRRQGEGHTLIFRMRRKEGSWMWAEGCISLYREEASGEHMGFVNVVRDITHRKEAEDRLQRAYNELEALAAIDSLTGIANRRHFDAVLDAEWKRAIRNGTVLSLLLIDVDFFKRFNDIYGHLAGDDCLRDVAATASECTRRSTDMVARFGGEEFAVILPETGETGAVALAERIRRTVQSHGIPHAGNTHGVLTISIGCAGMTPTRGSTCMPLIEAADKALYRAKNMGRNRVVSASQM